MTGAPPLHVTNGDVVAGLIGEEAVVPWRDVLHEGPVPGALTVSGLRFVRARFLASCGWVDEELALAEMRDRDDAVRDADELVLWFERDLYDQLQLLQVLDRLRGRPAWLVDIGEPAGPPNLAAPRERVTPEQERLGRKAWEAFRALAPTAIEEVLAGDTDALPFLGPALVRHLEQFPALEDGLSRTERTILRAIAAGARTRAEIFRAQADAEERPFMGDSAVWLQLDRLRDVEVPLITDTGDVVDLTPAGRAVLAGHEDAVRLNGIDRWLGGVRLQGDDAAWRWDGAASRIRAR